MKIVKRSGEITNFNRDKLKNSLLKSGTSAMMADAVLENIENKIKDGFSTKQIYKIAFDTLKKLSNSNAAKYNLQPAIQQLGPTGFYFEKFIARMYAAEHYQTEINLTLQGKCISHEIDVMIKKNDYVAMIECKFHNGKEANSDVKVPMYILSRFNDIRTNRHKIFTQNDTITNCNIVTNNRFTSDAIAFAVCSGINLLSWNYPENDNLKTKIDTYALYPITCLTYLTFAEKQEILKLNIILVKELLNNPDCLTKINLSPNRIKNVLKEAGELCKHLNHEN